MPPSTQRWRLLLQRHSDDAARPNARRFPPKCSAALPAKMLGRASRQSPATAPPTASCTVPRYVAEVAATNAERSSACDAIDDVRGRLLRRRAAQRVRRGRHKQTLARRAVETDLRHCMHTQMPSTDNFEE
eukprot:4389156-Pleurochrysis_carterae.AAC.2